MNANPPFQAVPYVAVNWAGEELHLLPSRAVWWPAQRVLFVADLHIGKAATYRRLGQPVPSGTTRDNLALLDILLTTHRPQQVVFLGDFLHAASGRTPTVLKALSDWRARHAAVAMTLVRGNHDDRAGNPPPEARIDVVDEPWLFGPFACCHHPQAHNTHFVLAGHLHPVYSLQGPGRDRLRLPCFVVEANQAVLPAFGAFTGGHACVRERGRFFYVIAGARVWAVPPH